MSNTAPLRKTDAPIRTLEKHHTQRAAERATEAELNRRGISTAKTDGNEPSIDLVAIHPRGRLIPIEVKGQQGRNDWFIAQPQRDDTVYVLVSVPTTGLDAPGEFQFFIMTAAEIREVMETYLRDRRSRGTSDDKWKPAIRWRDGLPYKNCWNKLEGYQPSIEAR